MEHELRLRGIDHRPQAALPVVYKGLTLDVDLRTDLLFPGKLVVELKAVEKSHPIHEAQLLTYMRLTKVHVGLLINFCVPVLKDGIKRLVL
jgi:GxxExxY protein